jgi:HPt (histidine-containing phosphotransfer) domain-containing protein
MNPAPPAPDTSAIDADAIARLRRDLDPEGRHDIVPRILRTYDNSLSGMISKLEEIAVSLDRDALFQVAHKMKSSSASVGALALGTCCTEVDRAIRDGQPLDVGLAVATLLAEGRRAQAAVRAMLGS